MKIYNFIFFVLSLAVLSACTTNTPYPDDWPEIENYTKHSCSNFKIHYENYNGESFLSDLFDFNVIGPKEDAIIELSIENTEVLKVTLYNEDKKPQKRELTLSRNEFSCEDGIIGFKKDREFYSHQVVMATSRAEVELYNSDSHVVAKIAHKSFSLVMFLLLPVKNNNIVWDKWEQTSAPEETSEEKSK